MPLARNPTSRSAKVARREKRRQKQWKPSRPMRRLPKRGPGQWPGRRKALAQIRPPRAGKFGIFRKKIAALALFGVVSFGATGCAAPRINASAHLDKVNALGPQARQTAHEAIAKASGNVLDPFLPYAGKRLGEKFGGTAAELFLGPDFVARLREIPRAQRFDYANGLPVLKEPWFKSLDLNSANPGHKSIIDFVERISSQSKVSPEEIALVAGAYPKFEWERKLFTLSKAIPDLVKQISALEEDIAKIRPQYAPKKKLFERLNNLYATRDLWAVEYLTLEALRKKGRDPGVESLIAVVNRKKSMQECRNALRATDTLVALQ